MSSTGNLIVFVDSFFASNEELLGNFDLRERDEVIVVESSPEPATTRVDEIVNSIRQKHAELPRALVGFGGGATLDTAKAVSNLLTNPGKAEDYQGWDLLTERGIPKIGIPTLPGTGAEASKTCVLTNPATGLKLGMNSEYSLFDLVILDVELTETVPKELLFFGSSDSFFHSIEILAGSNRTAIADAYAQQALNLLACVYDSDDITGEDNRESLMVASFLSGSALANGIVGLIHPFSAGLSAVLGIPHTVANCIVMRGMEPYYGEQYRIFWDWVGRHEIMIPAGLCANLSDFQFKKLYESTIVHSKPLENQLGVFFHAELTPAKVRQIFESL